MTDDHKTHDQVDHGDHTHGPGCGHTAIQHEGHTDYLHDGHMHHQHEGHHDEHAVGVTSQNPDSCTPDHSCSDHAAGINMVPIAATKLFRTGSTRTTLSAVTCIIHTVSTVTTTARSRPQDRGLIL